MNKETIIKKSTMYCGLMKNINLGTIKALIGYVIELTGVGNSDISQKNKWKNLQIVVVAYQTKNNKMNFDFHGGIKYWRQLKRIMWIE